MIKYLDLIDFIIVEYLSLVHKEYFQNNVISVSDYILVSLSLLVSHQRGRERERRRRKKERENSRSGEIPRIRPKGKSLQWLIKKKEKKKQWEIYQQNYE